ncbi:MAG: hypothetical protein CMF96_04150 [Candidatus Marinimicrobia bacterium]|nr:hypothetical protein [Candidatus Neomarinimicrobiota bacterium]
MKNTNKKHNFIGNFKNDNGKNRKTLKRFILNDSEWVQAFLQAQLDMKEMKSSELLKSVVF